MKKYFIFLFSFIMIFNCTNVWCNNVNEIYILDCEPTNIWDLSVNNDYFENSDLIVATDTVFYVSLRGFIEQFGNTIEWNKEMGNISFNVNNCNYEIISTEENGTVNTIPSFFKIRYAKIMNKDTNQYIVDKESEIIPIYTMNNTSYLNYVDFIHILVDAGCGYKLDFDERILYINKYNYTEEYVKSIIKKDMTYSKTIGILGNADYYEALDEGGCKIRYRILEKYIEIIFRPYTDTSDMTVTNAYIIDESGSILELIKL